MAAGPAQAVDRRTLTFARRDGKDLLLDLHLPVDGKARRPAIVFLHGGGWSGGTRTTGPDFARFFAADGFVMASIEYRLTPGVVFPANLEDVRTAVRWLRANARELGLDAGRIGLWGTSAGGHLAALAGLAPKGRFEGSDNLDQSSAVHCVLDAYGPVKFDVMDAQTEAEKAGLQPPVPALAGRSGGGPPRVAQAHNDPASPESRLLGAPVATVPDRVREASPLTYVTRRAPPFLIMHGLADNAVPHGQSVMLYEALKAVGAEATLRLIDGLPHTFYNRTDLDDTAGPFSMTVRRCERGREWVSTERAGVFDVARGFFAKHLM